EQFPIPANSRQFASFPSPAVLIPVHSCPFLVELKSPIPHPCPPRNPRLKIRVQFAQFTSFPSPAVLIRVYSCLFVVELKSPIPHPCPPRNPRLKIRVQFAPIPANSRHSHLRPFSFMSIRVHSWSN